MVFKFKYQHQVFLPKRPIATSTRDATIIAPWSSRILLCHSSVLASGVKALITAVGGHFHSGWLRMANAGTINAKLPPWMIGNLVPKVLCRRVTIPETNIIVEIIWALAGSSSKMHMAGHRIKGTETVPPAIIM